MAENAEDSGLEELRRYYDSELSDFSGDGETWDTWPGWASDGDMAQLSEPDCGA